MTFKNLKNVLLFFAVIHFETNAFSQQRSEKALSIQFSKNKLTAQLKQGFHFNEKAPNKIYFNSEGVIPNELQPQQITFEWLTKNHADLPEKASLFVCDDAQTFCETHILDLTKIMKSSKNFISEKKIKDSTKKNQNSKTESIIDHNGFRIDSFENALKETKNIALLDFSARWCPGCVRFDTEVFSQKKFKDQFSTINKIKIDTDLLQNFSISEKYKIIGIPTLIFVNHKGEEISRIVGFEELDRLSEVSNSILKAPQPLSFYKSNISTISEEIKNEVSRRFSQAEDYESIVSLFEKSQPQHPDLLNARIQISKKNLDQWMNSNKKTSGSDLKKDSSTEEEFKEKYIKSLQQALETEKESTRSLDWRTQLVALLQKKKPRPLEEIEKIKIETIKIADKLLADPLALKSALKNDQPGEYLGIESWLVMSYKIDMLETAESSPETITQVYKDAIKLGESLHFPMEKEGLNLRLLTFYMAAKDWDGSEKHVQKMIKYSPENFDLKRRYIKILQSTKRFKEAKQLAQEVLKNSEGRNEFWVVESLAKAQIELNEIDDAKKLIQSYLTRKEFQNELLSGKLIQQKKSFEKIVESIESKKIEKQVQ